MDDARQIRQRLEAIMERMGQSVRLKDQRLDPAESIHRGYRTKSQGTDLTWEFRFLEVPPGLQIGSLLSLEGDADHWRVESLEFERDGNELLFVSAHVASLELISNGPDNNFDACLQGLKDLLEQSSLGPLEQDDVLEVLARMRRLGAVSPSPEAGARIQSRLKLLNERFKVCPQTAHAAKGQLLRLEALLKRKGIL